MVFEIHPWWLSRIHDTFRLPFPHYWNKEDQLEGFIGKPFSNLFPNMFFYNYVNFLVNCLVAMLFIESFCNVLPSIDWPLVYTKYPVVTWQLHLYFPLKNTLICVLYNQKHDANYSLWTAIYFFSLIDPFVICECIDQDTWIRTLYPFLTWQCILLDPQQLIKGVSFELLRSLIFSSTNLSWCCATQSTNMSTIRMQCPNST